MMELEVITLVSVDGQLVSLTGGKTEEDVIKLLETALELIKNDEVSIKE